MSSSSSDSDDVPLSSLGKQKVSAPKPAAPKAPKAKAPAPAKRKAPPKAASDGEAEFDVDAAPPPKKAKAPPKGPPAGDRNNAGSSSDSSDDDVPLASLVHAKPAARKPAARAPPRKAPAKKKAPPPPSSSDDDADDESSGDDGSDSDSDDSDVPLSALSKKRKPAAKAAPKAKKAGRRTSTKPQKRKGGLAEAAFYETSRGMVLQQLLRRWWYVVDWPSAEAKAAPVKDPECWEKMDGMPGVHLCWKGDDVGKVVDHRDHSASPCFKNYYTKPTAELRDLVLKACAIQMAQLLEAEPGNERFIRELKKVIADVTRVNPAKADVEAAKAVKQYDAHPHKCG